MCLSKTHKWPKFAVLFDEQEAQEKLITRLTKIDNYLNEDVKVKE